ncbi:MAG: neutral zinc metallopeptidase [Thermomicrobiales bacterium]
MRAFLIAIAIIAMLLPVSTFAQSRQPVNDSNLVERTVLEITRLQQRGNGHELYDWLSDLSRSQIPRGAFAQWVDDSAAFTPVSDPEIGDIAFGDLFWPVTGSTLPNVASIEIEQEGTQLGFRITERTTIHLLNEGSRWRWLFGESQADVAAIVDHPIPTSAYESDFLDEPMQSIDRFWADVFRDLDVAYRPIADVVAINTVPYETACGTESDIASAGIYLCLLDQTIYYSPALRKTILNDFGDIGWHTIIAHEWAHQVQVQRGIIYAEDPELDNGSYILELETQADCMTGIYMQAQLGEDTISRADTQAVRTVLAAYGDFREVSWDNPIAHGSSEQRVASFNLGFRQGFVGCGLDLDSWKSVS